MLGGGPVSKARVRQELSKLVHGVSDVWTRNTRQEHQLSYECSRYRTSVQLRVLVLVSTLKPILALNKYAPHEYSSNSRVLTSIQILTSICIYSRVISMILMSTIPLYRYIALKYMIYAAYMMGLGH